MFKDVLKKEQPVVYQTLSNALIHKKVAHAYIFNGPAGTPKLDCALLLTQSLLCEDVDEDGFACEECSECNRITSGSFADMIILDGSETSIKKEHVLKLQAQFNKTGLEHTGKKIYILNRAENATPDALNSLLKFLEEPGSDMVAILLVEQMDRLLPTIASRCQIVPFLPMTVKYCYEISKQELENLDAYLLSNIITHPKMILEVAQSDEYQHAIYVFKLFQEEFLDSPYYALAVLQNEGFDNKKKRNAKLCMQYFLEILMSFYRDILQETTICEDAWYQDMMKKFLNKQYDAGKLLTTILGCRDQLLKSVNIALLSDQLVYNMKEAIK